MPVSKSEKEYVVYVVELMQSLGPVTAKGMFGGHGIFLEGLMFGLVAEGVLYLKVDEEILSQFKDRNLDVFTYDKKGKKMKMSYYQAPDEALEDSEEMCLWANKSYGASLRAAAKKR